MPTTEDIIKRLILNKYRSVRAFSVFHEIPYSTIDNLFKRGIGCLSLNTCQRIISPLNLQIAITYDGINVFEAHNGPCLLLQKV